MNVDPNATATPDLELRPELGRHFFITFLAPFLGIALTEALLGRPAWVGRALVTGAAVGVTGVAFEFVRVTRSKVRYGSLAVAGGFLLGPPDRNGNRPALPLREVSLERIQH